jgi:hypothetical protein
MSMKTCNKCGSSKELSEFYRDPGNSDGRMARCKDCHCLAATLRQIKNADQIREYDRIRSKDPKRKEMTRKYKRNANLRNPQRSSAQQKVSYAVRTGRMIRMPCETCGTTEQVHAHHDDYSRPLDVRWLCRIHHTQHHAAVRNISRTATSTMRGNP